MFFVEKFFRCSLAQFQQSCITVFYVNKNTGNCECWGATSAGLTAGAIRREPVVTTSWLSA